MVIRLDRGGFRWAEVSRGCGSTEQPEGEARAKIRGSPILAPILFTTLLLSTNALAQTQPTVFNPGPQETDEGVNLPFIVDATDADGDPLTYHNYPESHLMPRGATYDEESETFSWTPRFDQAGEYEFYLYVTDNKDGFAYVYVPITVHNVSLNLPNVAPVLSPIESQLVDEGKALSFPVSATDANLDRLYYGVTGIPEGARLHQKDAKAVFSWVPRFDQAGSYDLIFSVSDTQLLDGESVRITVREANDNPVLSVSPSATLTVDEDHLLEFEVAVSEPDGDQTSTSCYPPAPFGFPRGATYTPSTRRFSWTPDQDQAGEHEFYVLAKDDRGGWDREQVEITVNDFVHVPQVSPPPAPYVNSSPLLLQGTKDASTSIWINGTESLGLSADTVWSCTYALSEGSNTLSITAKNENLTESACTFASTYLDTSLPLIHSVTPDWYTIVARPTISATFSDTGSGINTDRVTLMLDNAAVEASATITSNKITYTPDVDLATGTHRAEVSVEDLASNVDKFSWTFELDLGTKVEPPEIGDATVWANDKSAYVYFSTGTLDATTVVHVIPANEISWANLTRGVTAGVELLNAVELLPHGFNLGASITFGTSLRQPQIPGTPLKLGYYKSNSGVFEETGEMVVDKSSYWTTVDIDHFSTYGALKGLVSSGAPLGGGVEIPLPDLYTGSFSHAISLEVPPARKEMQPSLQLLYKSGNRNGSVGQGWELNPGYIERSTKNGVPKYVDPPGAGADDFVFVSAGSRMELVNLIDNLFQARIESGFVKFFKEEDGSWRAVQKDGTQLFYGTVAASRMTNVKGTFRWCLDKILDPNTNYIELSYTEDQNQLYLSQVQYTGHEGAKFAPRHTVDFTYEARTDTRSSYMSGEKVTTAQRLKEVAMNVDFSLAWKYVLAYSYSNSTKASLLSGITRYGSDNAPFPTTTMTYQTGGGP